jgi:hypothetical protein
MIECNARTRGTPNRKLRVAKMKTRRMVAIATAIVAVTLLAGWWYIFPGDLPFAPPVPK